MSKPLPSIFDGMSNEQILRMVDGYLSDPLGYNGLNLQQPVDVLQRFGNTSSSALLGEWEPTSDWLEGYSSWDDSLHTISGTPIWDGMDSSSTTHAWSRESIEREIASAGYYSVSPTATFFDAASEAISGGVKELGLKGADFANDFVYCQTFWSMYAYSLGSVTNGGVQMYSGHLSGTGQMLDSGKTTVLRATGAATPIVGSGYSAFTGYDLQSGAQFPGGWMNATGRTSGLVSDVAFTGAGFAKVTGFNPTIRMPSFGVSVPQTAPQGFSVGFANRTASALLDQEGLAYQLKYVDRHLPNTPQSLKLIEREGAAHVFTDKATLGQVEGAIFERGQYTGTLRGWERYGLHFEQPIGYRIGSAGEQIPLNYGELKFNPQTGTYHVIPRTGASQ